MYAVMLHLYGHRHIFKYAVEWSVRLQTAPPTQRLSQPTVVLMHLMLVNR